MIKPKRRKCVTQYNVRKNGVPGHILCIATWKLKKKVTKLVQNIEERE